MNVEPLAGAEAPPPPAEPRDAPTGDSRRAVWSGFAVVQVVALVLMAAGAYFRIFSGFNLYDDEGFMMLTVRHVVDGHRLYDDVLTAYGPAYYFYKWLLHGVAGLPLTHDVVRCTTIVFWLGGALASAVIVFGTTRSLALAVLAQILVVCQLRNIANEPGHPQEVVALLVAAIVATFLAREDRNRTRALAGSGLLVGILTMVKINLGLFAGAAVWMALVMMTRAGRGAMALRAGSTAAVAALPFLLTRAGLAQGWMPFAARETASILAIAALSLRGERGRRPAADLPRFLVACAAGVALGALFALLRGTSLAGMVDCLVLLPLRLKGGFGDRPLLSAWMLPPTAVDLGCAVVCARLGPQRLRTGRGATAVAIGKLWVALRVVAALRWAEPLRFLVMFGLTPLLWLLLVPPPGASLRPETRATRLVLVWVAALQPLQAYPVWGSQLSLGTFPHVICALIGLGDVLTWARTVWSPLARPAVRRASAGIVLAAIATMTLNRLETLRVVYVALTPLPLPGAERVRTDPGLGRSLRWLVDRLREHADSFLTDPGFNSLYFWTGIAPPTLDVFSHQVELHPPERREAMIRALLTHEHPYVVRFLGLAPPYLPFREEIDRYFEPDVRIGRFWLLVRRN